MSGPILVTGATGFVGRHLIPALQARDFEVLPRSLREDLPTSIPGSVSHVFHLAAKTYVPESWSHPLSFYEANVLGTVKVLDFCRRVDAPVTIISSYVYGNPESLPVSEDHPVQAFNPYSHSKILAEQVAKYYAEGLGVHVTLIRPFNLYGPSQDCRFLIPTLLRQALDPASSVISVADARPRRDFLFIADFIDLLIRSMRSTPRAFEIFNAGSGASVSIADLCEAINVLTGAPKVLVSRGESRPDEVFDVFSDVSKASRELGWRPQTSLEQGLALTIDALKRIDSEYIG
ncbi:MAG TPA: NAD(P)-dependent oxidoreductase [Bryobacteraceae bacterium]|jgi:UDP-glucose 4-epimerase|nr:NAD(P)-dependent oxidoreductase [Bryobacteraceae bacterium]